MLVLLPFFIVSALAAVCLCGALAYTGAVWLGMLLLFFVGALVASLLLFVVFCWLMGLPVDMNKPQPRPSRFYRWLMHCIMALLVTLSRIRLQVSGTELLPEGRWLLVCNHRSNMTPS